MKTLILNMPESIELDEKEAIAILASKLYEQGKLSLGQAAEFAGYSKRAFLDVLSSLNVSLFNQHNIDLEQDILNATSHHI